jgi:hypothetical protein
VVQVLPAPEVNISSSSGLLQFCQGQFLQLTAPGGFSEYTWSNGQSGQVLQVGSVGSYSVAVVDANGCTGTSDAVYVESYTTPQPTITANGPTEFCQGGFVQLATSTGFGSYNWTNGGTGVTTTVIASGFYTVTVTDQFLCSGTSAPIEIVVIPTVSSYIDNVGDSLFAVPTNGINHQWFLNGTPIPGATQPYHLAGESGIYTVRFTDENGCVTNSEVNEFTYSGGNVSVYETGVVTSLELFPNPGAGWFVVRGVLSRNADVRLVITDVVGRELNAPIHIGHTDLFNQDVDISGFANGVYLVKVMVGNGMHLFRYIKT